MIRDCSHDRCLMHSLFNSIISVLFRQGSRVGTTCALALPARWRTFQAMATARVAPRTAIYLAVAPDNLK